MSVTTTSRRSSVTCIFEDLERKSHAQFNVNTDKVENSSREMAIPLPVASSPISPTKTLCNGLNQKNPSNHLVDESSDATLGDSSAVSTVSIGEMCKICHCGSESGNSVSLIAPCYCSGSLKYVHQECLQRWIKSSDIKRCELCKYPFAMQAKVKPFCQWEKLDMTALERRKLFCSVTFHVVAITCVVWSLYVLIDRTAEEIRNGELQWPFWTKLVVVAIGFTGGLVFMYIQCKVYVHLCRKWKAYNRTIVVQDAPEGVHKPSDRQLNKSSAASSHLDSASSRRSSSAPSSAAAQLSQQQPLQPQSTSTTTNNRDLSVSTSAGNGNNTSLTEKTNAETQTALRGVAILEGECGHAHTTSFGHAHFSGSSPRVHEEAVFFTECECDLQSKSVTTVHQPQGQQNAKNNAKVGVAKTTTEVVLPNTSGGGGNGGRGTNHSISTPNVAALVPRPSSSRRDRQTTQTNRARPARKFSLSPVRRSELPGSPDVDFTNESSLVEHAVPSTQLKQIGTGGCTTKRHATVLSPIKKPYKNKA